MLNLLSDRPLGGGEKKDVDANKSYGCLLSSLVIDNDISKIVLTSGRSS